MNPAILSRAARLPDQQLVARVKRLAHHEREATAVLIAHLAALDERRLYLAEGYASMFAYCTQALHLSEHSAYARIETARAVRKFPLLLQQLAAGAGTLTTVGLLAAHLTPENHAALLDAARHKSKREVEELLARLHPRPPVPSAIRKLPMARGATGPAQPWETTLPAAMTSEAAMQREAATSTPPMEDAASPEPRMSAAGAAAHADLPLSFRASRPAVIEPLAPERYKVQFTATAEMHAKLRLAQDLLRHQIPDGDLGQVIDRALTVLLEGLVKQKFAATNRPRGHRDDLPRDPEPATSSRHIPAVVRRTVWLRDGGRCAFVASTGHRCMERAFLEFHHVVPYSMGGEATTDNIELRCRAHNGFQAELDLRLHRSSCANCTPALMNGPADALNGAAGRRRAGLHPEMIPSKPATPG